MTREEAQQVEQQLSKRYPGGIVEVTCEVGGVHVEAHDADGWTVLDVANDSPLFTLFGAYPETEPGELPEPDGAPSRYRTLIGCRSARTYRAPHGVTGTSEASV